MHRAHIAAIPFESLDVTLQRPREDARVALLGRELTRWYPDGRVVERKIVAPRELIALLDREFGPRLSERDEADLVGIFRAED